MSVQKGKQGGQTTGFNRPKYPLSALYSETGNFGPEKVASLTSHHSYQSRPQPSQRDGGFPYTTSQSANAGAANSMRMGMPQAHVQPHAPQVHQQHAAAVAQHAVVVAQQHQQQQQQQHGVAVPGGPGAHGHGGHGGSPASGAAQTQTPPGDMGAHQHALGYSMNAQRQPNASFYRAPRMPGRNVIGVPAQSFVQMPNIQSGMPFHQVILNSSIPQMQYSAAPNRPMANTSFYPPQPQGHLPMMTQYASQRPPYTTCYFTIPPQSGQPNVQPSQQQSPAQPTIGMPMGIMPTPPVHQNDPNLPGMSQNKGNQKRKNAIPIIDPDTHKEVDPFNESENSPGSGSSSNRETPRPESHGHIVASVGKNEPSNEPKSVVNGPGPGGPSGPGGPGGPAPAHLTTSPSQFHIEEPPSLESWKRPNELEAEEVPQQPLMMYHQTMVAPMPLHSLQSFSQTPVVSARSDGPSVDVYKGQRAGSQQFSPQRKKNDLSNSQFQMSDAAKGKKSGPPQSTAPAHSSAAPAHSSAAPAHSVAAPHVPTPDTAASPTTAPAPAAAPLAPVVPAIPSVPTPQAEPPKVAEQATPVAQSEAKVVEPPSQTTTRSPDAVSFPPVDEPKALTPGVTEEAPTVAADKHESSPAPAAPVSVPTPSASPPATTPAAVTPLAVPVPAPATASSSETTSPTSTTAPPTASAALGSTPTVSAAAPSSGSGQAAKGGHGSAQGKEGRRVRNHERNAQHKEEKQPWNERGGKGGKPHAQVASEPTPASASPASAATPASVPEGKHTGGGRGGGRQANGDNADSHDSGKPSNKKGKKMRELASKSAEKSPDGSEAQVEPAPSSSASSSATSSGPAPAQAPAPAPASAPATAAVSPAPVASPAASAQATSAATSSPAVPVTEAPKEASASPALGGTVPSSAPAAPTPAAAAIAPTGTTTKAPAPETAATAPPEAAQARPNAPKNSYSAAANPFLAPPFASGPPEQAVVPSFRDNDKEDKFVAARNEENSKVSASMKNDMVDTIPVKSATPVPKLSYTEDQWSPFNPTGKKKYGRDLLMQIRLDPKSQKKPENLPEIDVLRKEDKSKGSLSRSMAQFGDFSSGLLRSNNPRGVPLQRKSTQGNKPGKPGKSSIIHMSLSLREDVKLHETENAWKPQMMKNEPVLSEEEAKTQEIYKTVRGVLNKLTPEKFNRLMAIVEELPIDNKQRMEGVIDLVFNKAVDEPNFSVAYAQMCNLLQRKEVPVEKNDGGEKVQFRKILISRCQKEFENSKAAELNKDEKQKEIENETDPEKKKELMFNFEEEERKIRRKSVGLVRFIGELFKKQMLTHQIMMRCVKDLLSKKDEESYECMCKLLTTIGDILESKGHTNELDQVFAEMRSLADKEKGGKNISSRVRFMLQDVIDLRDNKWVSRHGDTAPKTMEQIQRDAERENLESTIALSSQPNTPRKDERGAGRNMGSMDRRGNRGNQGSYGGKDDGWTNVLSNHRPRNVDFQKLRQNDSSQESLGSQVFFKSWSSGSQVQKETKKFTTPNKFDILPPDNSLSRPERNNPVVSRGSNSFKRTDSNLSSRSNSQQRLNSQPPSRESSVVRGESQKEKEDTKKRSAVSPPAPNKPVDLPAPDLVDEEEIKAACIKIIPETLGNISDVEEAYVCVEAAVGKSNYHHFVREIALLSLQNKSQGHDDIGKLIVSFMDKDVLDSSHLVSELAVIIETGPDIIFDAPMVWKYLADLLVPVIEAGKLSFKDVAQAATFLKENVPNHAVKFLQSLIQPFVLNKGPNWLRTHWEKHSVNWGDFLAEKDIEAFLADNNVSFMKGNVNPSEKGGSGSGLNQKEICDKLTELLRDSDAKDSFDAIREWITVNVGSGVKNKDFIYSLVTAICKSSLSESGGTWKLNNSLSQHDKLLAAYLDNVPEYEEQCLLAVEALVHSLEHPKGVIHTVFEFLWTNALVSVEAFQNWQKSGGPDGHGVAVSSLTSFFTMLSEADITDDEEA